MPLLIVKNIFVLEIVHFIKLCGTFMHWYILDNARISSNYGIALLCSLHQKNVKVHMDP